MTQNLISSLNKDTKISTTVDMKLFLLALHSYPERFQHQPGITFEQHFWSLAAAAQPALRRSHAAGR